MLEDINFSVEAGSFVTIIGTSGGGKTTLVKIVLGLLEPTSGEVLVDGISLCCHRPAPISRADRRGDAGGSAAGGIDRRQHLLFESGFDENWMIQCAQLAAIHDEIMQMPMTYNSLVGDMGSSLSGGQKQRVLLARALYRRPRVLFSTRGRRIWTSATRRASSIAACELVRPA